MKTNYLIKQIKQFAFSSIIAATALSSASFAYDRVGNGGDAVVCKDKNGKIKSVELLDLYEGINLGRVDSYIEENGRRFDEIVEDRLKLIDRYTHSTMQDDIVEYANDLTDKALLYEESGVGRYKNVKFSPNVLVDISDSEHLSFPEGCEVNQIAIKRKDFDEGEVEFLFRSSLWDKMSELSKAALILHEAIYKTFEDLDNSIPVRSFNQKVLNSNFESMNLKRFLRAWEKLDKNIVSVLYRKNLKKNNRVIKLERKGAFYFGYKSTKYRNFGIGDSEVLRVSQFTDYFREDIRHDHKVVFRSEVLKNEYGLFTLSHKKKVFIVPMTDSVNVLKKVLKIDERGHIVIAKKAVVKGKLSIYLYGNAEYILYYNGKKTCEGVNLAEFERADDGYRDLKGRAISCAYEVDVESKSHEFEILVSYYSDGKRVSKRFRYTQVYSLIMSNLAMESSKKILGGEYYQYTDDQFQKKFISNKVLVY